MAIGSGMDAAINNASKALDTSGIGANTVAGLQAGMSLAQRQQEIENSRKEMQFKSDQMDLQKHDWMHTQLKSAASEDDPKLKGVLLDDIASQFPKMFDGKRMDPATLELMKKSPSFMDKFMATTRMREAARTNDYSEMGNMDKEILNGMTSSDMSQKLGHLNTIQAQETQIIKALTAAKVATPQAAGVAGQTQEEVQKTMNQNNPTAPRMAMVDLKKDDQANRVGSAFDNATKKVFSQTQALDRGIHTLEGGGKITPQIFHEIEQEFSNALSGAGSAGLGKLERTEYQSPGLKLAEMEQKYGGKLADLRETAPDFVNQLADSMKRLNQAYSENMEKIATNVHANSSQMSNPKAQEMRKQKLQQYAPKAYEKLYGSEGGETNPVNTTTGQPKEKILSPEEKAGIENDYVDSIRRARDMVKNGQPLIINGKVETEQTLKQHFSKLRQQYGLKEVNP